MEGSGAASTLVTIGFLLLVSLAASWLGHKTRLPRVSLLLLVGVVAGPLAFDVLPGAREDWFPVVSRVALVMVGFLIGGEFTAERLRSHGRVVGWITVGQGVATAVLVAAGLALLGVDPEVALLLGGVATATDPAATIAVIEEEESDGDASRTVLGIVALDDVIGIVAFSIMLTFAGVVTGSGTVGRELLTGGWELGGGILVGALLGALGSRLTGRLRPGEPILEEALALVFLCAGITWWLDVSYLIAAVVLGAVIANLASHHERPFRAVEGIEWPFLVLFFVLAGASVDEETIATAGLLVGYLVLRTIGKMTGAAVTAHAVGTEWPKAVWFGAALLPQAGVALGMALAGAERFPQHADQIVGVAVVSTVLFELVGPFMTRTAVSRLED